MSAALAKRTYEAYSDVLRGYLLRCLSSTERAHELTQEVYLRLLCVPDDRLVRYPQAYVFKIASHLVYELRRREQHGVVTFNSGTVDCLADSVSDHVNPEPGELLDMQQQIEGMLEHLPPLYATILVLKKQEGKTLHEIARELAISTHTAKKYLTQAVARCREFAGRQP